MEASPPASAAFVRGARPALPPVHVVDGARHSRRIGQDTPPASERVARVGLLHGFRHDHGSAGRKFVKAIQFLYDHWGQSKIDGFFAGRVTQDQFGVDVRPGVGDRHVGCVAAQSDQHAADSRNVVARIKGVDPLGGWI